MPLYASSAKGEFEAFVVDGLTFWSSEGLDGKVSYVVSGVPGHVFEDRGGSLANDVEGHLSAFGMSCSVTVMSDFDMSAVSDDVVVVVTCEVPVDESAESESSDVVMSSFGSAACASGTCASVSGGPEKSSLDFKVK